MQRVAVVEAVSWVKDAWERVTENTITAGYLNAGLLDFLEDKDEDDNDENERDLLVPEIAQLFESNSEDGDFEGFQS